jgi:hypothetical protein
VSAKAGPMLVLTMLVFSVLSVIDDLTLGGRLVAQKKALGPTSPPAPASSSGRESS